MKFWPKRLLALLLCIAMAVSVVGCSNSEETSKKEESEKDNSKEQEIELEDDEEENLEKIEEVVDELGAYRDLVGDVATEFARYLDSGETEDFVNNAETLAEYVDDIEKLTKKINKLPKNSENDEVEETYQAAKVYAQEVQRIYQDFSQMATFYSEFLQNIYTYTKAPSSNDLADYYNRLLNQYNTLQEKLNAMDCPEYFEHEFAIVIDSIGQFSALALSYYQGYALDDSLRLESSNYLNQVIQDEMNSSVDDLSINALAQFEVMTDIAEGRLDVLEEELLDNCDALLDGEKFASYTYSEEEKELDITYEYEAEIYPALYNHMDAVVTLRANCEQEECDVLVSVEIEGFTQKFEQTYTFDSRMKVLDVKPAISTTELDLSSAKTLQLVVSVTDVDSGKVYLKETKQVKIMSLYDWPSYDKDGNQTLYNILAWLEPEAEEIKQLKRTAIDVLPYLNYGGYTLDSLVGYQGANDFESAYWVVAHQVAAIETAMAVEGVKYNMSPFSVSDSDNYIQRVTLPSETLNSDSGICIETALVMASALQSAQMNAMLVLTKGHARVAVEIFDTGEYFLIETTAIPNSIPQTLEQLEASKILQYGDKEEWKAFIENEKQKGYCYIIECDMARELGYISFNN